MGASKHILFSVRSQPVCSPTALVVTVNTTALRVFCLYRR